jgi:hypothetical protein
MKKIYLSMLILFSVYNGNSQTCNGIDPAEGTGSTGCITFNYGAQPVVYTTVRAADGNIWLQQNMGSSRVAASSTDADAFGDLFQWGRWDDGHQKRTSQTSSATPTPNNPTGLGTGSLLFFTSDPKWWTATPDNTDSWTAASVQDITETNGCDPCRALGGGWHLPTQEEWQAIIDAEAITSPTAAFESSLKLPVAGSRSSSGNISSPGVRGYYWSSTISTTNVNFVKYFFLTSLTINTNAGAYREQGSSVRCLKSPATAGLENFSKPQTLIYPNPIIDVAVISSPDAIAAVSVYDVAGKLIYAGTNNTISLAGAEAGLYVIHIRFHDGSYKTVKATKK